MKIQKYLLLICFVWNSVFIPIYHVKVVQDDISSKPIRLWLCNALKEEDSGLEIFILFHQTFFRIRQFFYESRSGCLYSTYFLYTTTCPGFLHRKHGQLANFRLLYSVTRKTWTLYMYMLQFKLSSRKILFKIKQKILKHDLC